MTNDSTPSVRVILMTPHDYLPESITIPVVRMPPDKAQPQQVEVTVRDTSDRLAET